MDNQLNPWGADTTAAASSCCSPAEQEACCAPEDKDDCCGTPSAGDGGCACL